MRPPDSKEELIRFEVLLTRRQIRKVKELGGREWLRQLISNTRPSQHRDPVEHLRFLSERNKAIAADPRPGVELVSEYKLSKQQINAIRRAHRA